MGKSSLIFGDIFEYDESEYIYLGATTELIYVAKILPHDLSKQLNNRCQSLISRNKQTEIGGFLYCYIMLTTDELKDRAAVYGKPEIDILNLVFNKLPYFLNDKDLNVLKKDIINSRSVPKGLREIIEKTEIVLSEQS